MKIYKTYKEHHIYLLEIDTQNNEMQVAFIKGYMRDCESNDITPIVTSTQLHVTDRNSYTYPKDTTLEGIFTDIKQKTGIDGWEFDSES